MTYPWEENLPIHNYLSSLSAKANNSSGLDRLWWRMLPNAGKCLYFEFATEPYQQPLFQSDG